VIDSLGEPRAAHYASKRFYAPVLVTGAIDGDNLAVSVVNDRLSPIQGRVRAVLTSFDGTVITEEELAADTDANAARRCGLVDLTPARGRETGCVVTLTLANGDTILAEKILLLAEPKDLDLPDAELAVAVTDLDADLMQVTLDAPRFAAGVWLSAGLSEGGLSPEFSDNYFHMAPGSRTVVTVTKTAEIAAASDLMRRLKIRTLRDRS